jgi:hypothetical protein
MVSTVGAFRQWRDFAPDIGHAQRAPALQGPERIIVGAIPELPLRVCRKEEVATSQMVFCETVNPGQGACGGRLLDFLKADEPGR